MKTRKTIITATMAILVLIFMVGSAKTEEMEAINIQSLTGIEMVGPGLTGEITHRNGSIIISFRPQSPGRDGDGYVVYGFGYKEYFLAEGRNLIFPENVEVALTVIRTFKKYDGTYVPVYNWPGSEFALRNHGTVKNWHPNLPEFHGPMIYFYPPHIDIDWAKRGFKMRPLSIRYGPPIYLDLFVVWKSSGQFLYFLPKGEYAEAYYIPTQKEWGLNFSFRGAMLDCDRLILSYEGIPNSPYF